jgi:hypothetical protein
MCLVQLFMLSHQEGLGRENTLQRPSCQHFLTRSHIDTMFLNTGVPESVTILEICLRLWSHQYR